MSRQLYDAVVVGGGPAGATAAADLARYGREVMLIDRPGRIKPCGGAIPPRLIDVFAIPDDLLVARIDTARMVAPSAKHVDIRIKDGFVGMVDREVFDEYLRNRAEQAGATLMRGKFERLEETSDGLVVITYKDAEDGNQVKTVRTRMVVGADGANSQVAKQAIPDNVFRESVFAYHEIIESPDHVSDAFEPNRCDVVYDGRVSPDFYGWVFPHGHTTSVGVGSAHKGFSLRGATGELRSRIGLKDARTIRTEGAPIPLKPLPRWENGRNVLLAGDAAGVVAPSSGEGIFYAMTGGRCAADASHAFLEIGDARELARARKKFMRAHGGVFWILGMMQHYWYRDDNRRERFVRICHDKDVQELTFDAYMNKELVKARPLAHVRIFFKNLAHLSGLAPA